MYGWSSPLDKKKIKYMHFLSSKTQQYQVLK